MNVPSARIVIPALLAATILAQSFSFLSLKISTLNSGLWSAGFLMAAFGLMGLRAVLWQQLLRRAELSRVYPFTSLVQVLILAYAVILFGETVGVNHLLGLALMLGGVWVMAGE